MKCPLHSHLETTAAMLRPRRPQKGLRTIIEGTIIPPSTILLCTFVHTVFHQRWVRMKLELFCNNIYVREKDKSNIFAEPTNDGYLPSTQEYSSCKSKMYLPDFKLGEILTWWFGGLPAIDCDVCLSKRIDPSLVLHPPTHFYVKGKRAEREHVSDTLLYTHTPPKQVQFLLFWCLKISPLGSDQASYLCLSEIGWCAKSTFS